MLIDWRRKRRKMRRQKCWNIRAFQHQSCERVLVATSLVVRPCEEIHETNAYYYQGIILVTTVAHVVYMVHSIGSSARIEIATTARTQIVLYLSFARHAEKEHAFDL